MLNNYSLDSLYNELELRLKSTKIKDSFYFNIILFGPPGSGKGTQAEELEKLYSLCKFSSGDIFRYNVNNKTKYGLEAKSIMDRGDLLPDDLAYKMLNIEDFINSEKCKKGIIFDGFPRTQNHIDHLNDVLIKVDKPITHVIIFSYDKTEIINRVKGRLIHQSSGRVYHEIHKKPKVENRDDITGDLLTKREDDKNIEKRINIYENEILKEAQSYYKNNIHYIDSSLSIRYNKFALLNILGLLH